MKKITPRKLSNRLTQYGALSAAIAGITGLNAQEQISYNDISDVVVSPGTNYAVDLNDDMVGDIVFVVNPTGNGAVLFPISSISANYYNINGIVGSITNGFAYPFNLSNGEVINSANSVFYYGRGDLFWNSCSPNSNFCDGSDGFLGLRLNIPIMGGGFDTHYGWVRIQIATNPTSHSITIKDFAYNIVPGAQILAGQTTSLSLEEDVLSNIKIVTLDKSIRIYNLKTSTNYRLYNLTGQDIIKGTISNHDHTIEASTLASGVYIVELSDTNSNAVIRKKVVLQ